MKILTKEEAAAEIAEDQYEFDEDALALYRIVAEDEDAPDEPLKLLKISADTPPMGILPLHFPAKVSRGMDFAFELAVVTPEEFDDMKAGRLSLPEGWHLEQMLGRPHEAAEAAA